MDCKLRQVNVTFGLSCGRVPSAHGDVTGRRCSKSRRHGRNNNQNDGLKVHDRFRQKSECGNCRERWLIKYIAGQKYWLYEASVNVLVLEAISA